MPEASSSQEPKSLVTPGNQGISHESDRGKGKRTSTQQTSEFEGLDEVAVPPPVDRKFEDGRREHTLEDERDDENRQQSGAGTSQGDFSESSDSAQPPAFHQRQPASYLPTEPVDRLPRWLTELYAAAYLVLFSIFGTLARLGLQWLTFYAGAPAVTPVLWANVAGSFLMGFLAEDQNLFRDDEANTALEMKHHHRQSQHSADLAAEQKAESSKRKKTISLYIGLATGFCGSFTSFSSFERDVFLALSNDLPTPLNHPTPAGSDILPNSTRSRHNGYSVEAVLAVILLTIALCIGALKVGAHVAVFLDSVTPNFSKSVVRRIINPIAVFLGFGSWLGAVFLSIWPPSDTWRGEVLFALVFAPLGCLLRFYASRELNGLVPWFPLGTFAVNMLGTAILGMCYDIQHVGVGVGGMPGGGRVGCQVLQGIEDGFCGCLTTVSTWVAEINGLRLKHAYFYAIASTAGGLCLLIAIMGGVRWSAGWSQPVCRTGYIDKPF
ncbi:hypothetical protein MBLNU230_g0141t1 [Neophaeotheca triangularis]